MMKGLRHPWYVSCGVVSTNKVVAVGGRRRYWTGGREVTAARKSIGAKLKRALEAVDINLAGTVASSSKPEVHDVIG